MNGRRVPWWAPAALLAVGGVGYAALGFGSPSAVDLYTDDMGMVANQAPAAAASNASARGIGRGSTEGLESLAQQAASISQSSGSRPSIDAETTNTDPDSSDVATGSLAADEVEAGETFAGPSATVVESPGGPTPVATGSSPSTTAAPSTVSTEPVSPPSTTAEGAWCQVEVRAEDGVIRWNDNDRTAVIRRNDKWFHTPDPDAVAVLIPESVDEADEYVLRLWGGGNEDVICSFVATGMATPAGPVTTTTTANPTTTVAPTTTAVAVTTTPATTTIPPLAFVDLPSPIGIPSGPPQIGFTVDMWGDERTAYWNELEAAPGAGRLIAHEFSAFEKPLKPDLYRWHMSEGRDLLLTWNGTYASQILDGSNDEWIRSHARILKTLPDTVMLRFWHEPDVRYKQDWIEGDPQNFIDAWMHVRRIFVEEGAVSNIEWVWCPTSWNWNERGPNYYPGDDAVDWICADGYSGMDLSAPLTPIWNEFTAFQAWANQRGKPIIIAEFGATPREPGVRADWVEQIPQWVDSQPLIKAVVYYDYFKNGEEWDWRLRTESDAWQAMKDVVGHPTFG